jgi:hypothetical protein
VIPVRLRKPSFETLEVRRLLASASWLVEYTDPNGASVPFRTVITDFITRAGDEWAALVPQEVNRPAVTLRVQVVVGTENATGSSARLSAKSNTTTLVSLATNIFDQTATARLRYGDAPLPGPDIVINIHPDALTSELFFDPDPASRGTPQQSAVPTNKVDAYSAILHELGHVFFFNGFRDDNTYQLLDPTTISPFDSFFEVEGAQPLFNGSNAVAANGGQLVPLTRNNPYHLGNPGGPGADLVALLMNGSEFEFGKRYFISTLERAVVEDLVVAGTRPPPVIDPGGEDPPPDIIENFSNNVSYTYTGPTGPVTLLIRGTGSGRATFPGEGTNTAPKRIEIFGTTTRSTVTITANAGTVLPDFAITSAVGTLSAPAVTFTGTVSLSGAINLTLGGLTAANLTVGGSAKASTYTLGSVLDSNVSVPAVKTIRATRVFNSDTARETLAVGGALGSLTVVNELDGNVNVNGNLGKTSAGLIGPGAWSITGAVTSLTVGTSVSQSAMSAVKWGNVTVAGSMNSSSIAANAGTLGNVRVNGALSNSLLAASGGIGAVTLASTTSSRIVTGLAPSAAPTALPTTSPAWTTSGARLRSLTVLAGGAFADSLIIAPTAGPLSLATVAVSNQSRKFGIFADTSSTLRGATTKDPALNLKAQRGPFSYTDLDFAITIA